MIENIAKALVAAQAEMTAAPMNAVNPFLKNKYADLGSIIATVRPVLAKHGLAFSQLAVGEGGEVGVRTILMHSSGEFIEDAITLPLTDERGKSGAQVAGSIITYLRRYSLSAILGIYADEDTDGNGTRRNRADKPTPQKQAVGGSIFETVETKDGDLYSTLEMEDLMHHFNGITKHLKDNPDLGDDARAGFELKRDAAEYFIKQKKE